MSMCGVFSCVVGRGCLLWAVCSLGKTLLAFALLHSVLQSQICLLLQVFLDFLLLRSSPLYWKGHLFWVLVLEGLVGLHRTVQLSFFSITGWGIDIIHSRICMSIPISHFIPSPFPPWYPYVWITITTDPWTTLEFVQSLEHGRLPCPSLSPVVCSNSCPLSQWCYITISSSAA